MKIHRLLESLAVTVTVALSPAPASAQVAAPVVPVLDEATRDRLAAVLASPAGAANSRDTFIKVGDSITESGSFLKDLGCQSPPDPAMYGEWAGLIPVTTWFRTHAFAASYTDAWCRVANSFSRASVAAVSGVTSAFAFAATSACPAPYNTTLRCEIYKLRPSFALVMFGTNDVMVDVNLPLADALARYRANLERIVAQSVADGVVPVLSTIPPLVRASGVSQAMVDRVASYNAVVAEVAAATLVPLWNYHRALLDLGPTANYGVSSDGIHPSIYNRGDGANFSAAALRYGYNVRNLTALQVLATLKAALVDAPAAPALGTASLPTGIVGSTYRVLLTASGSPLPTFAADELPPGLALDGNTGVLAGTPLDPGTWLVAVTASNGQAPDATATLPLTVLERVAPTFTSAAPGPAYTRLAFRFVVTAAGRPAPTFAAAGLPPGLRLDATTGVISGTATAVGTYAVTLSARNATAPDGAQSFALDVLPGASPALTTAALPAATRGVAYAVTLAATGAPAPTFTATGLPSGLRLNALTGLISGTPTRAATSQVTVGATNGILPKASRVLSLTVQ